MGRERAANACANVGCALLSKAYRRPLAESLLEVALPGDGLGVAPDGTPVLVEYLVIASVPRKQRKEGEEEFRGWGAFLPERGREEKRKGDHEKRELVCDHHSPLAPTPSTRLCTTEIPSAFTDMTYSALEPETVIVSIFCRPAAVEPHEPSSRPACEAMPCSVAATASLSLPSIDPVAPVHFPVKSMVIVPSPSATVFVEARDIGCCFVCVMVVGAAAMVSRGVSLFASVGRSVKGQGISSLLSSSLPQRYSEEGGSLFLGIGHLCSAPLPFPPAPFFLQPASLPASLPPWLSFLRSTFPPPFPAESPFTVLAQR